MFYRRLKRTLAVVSALRSRRHPCYRFSAFFVCTAAGFDSKNPGADPAGRRSAEMEKEEAFKIEISDGLLLYYDRFSFYSQKVIRRKKVERLCKERFREALGATTKVVLSGRAATTLGSGGLFTCGHVFIEWRLFW